MKKHRNLGILLSAFLLFIGMYLLRGSADFRPFTELVILVGATISALGLMAAAWSVECHLSLKRLEHHFRPNRQS